MPGLPQCCSVLVIGKLRTKVVDLRRPQCYGILAAVPGPVPRHSVQRIAETLQYVADVLLSMSEHIWLLDNC